jgi:hypothetical protein
LRLVGDKVDVQLACQLCAGADLICRPFRDADIEGLACAYDVRESDHRLFQRGRIVVAVRLIEVHVVGLQTAQGAIDAFHDVLAGEAAIVLTRADVPEHLREDLEALAALTGQRPTEDLLRPGIGVDVRGVEGSDSGVDRGPDACVGGVLGYLGRVCDPVAVRDLTDHQTAAAEVSVLHAISLGGGWIAGDRPQRRGQDA